MLPKEPPLTDGVLDVIAEELPLPEVFPVRDDEFEESELEEPVLAGDVYDGDVDEEELGEEDELGDEDEFDDDED